MKLSKFIKGFKIKFKKYLSTNILFSSYLVITILLSLSLRMLTVGNQFIIKPILCDLMFAVLIGSFGYFFKPHNQFKYFFTLTCIFTFLCIANSLYFTFYKSFLSLSLIESMVMLKDVKTSVTDKISLIHLVYVIFPIILIIIHNKLSAKKYYFEMDKIEKSSVMFKKTLIGGFILLGLCATTITFADASRIAKQWNRDYVMQRFGLYVYTSNDFIQSLRPKINTMFGYDKAALEFREFYKNEATNNISTNKYTGIYEGKNLLVIHAESIQNFLIGLKINGQEVTPNLNRLAEKSLYFNNFYPQISTGTSSDTEFTFETGLLPSTNGIVFTSYFDREYQGISSILKSKGYYTFAMHANNGDYWNRNVMYKTLGYDKYYSKDSYVVNEEDVIGLGLSDKEFFKQSEVILNNIKNNNIPFYGKIITLTNHSPFDQIDKYGEFDLTLPYSYTDDDENYISGVANYLEDTEMGNYLKSAHYADEALGEFIDSLEKNNILENTVFVLYGDHEAKISKKQFNLLYNYDPITDDIISEDDENYISFENYKYDLLRNTPLIIYDGEHTETINTLMGMYDLLPTFANMFNFKCDYAMGHDVFSNYEKIVIFPNGNFLTEKVYYNSLRGNYIILTDEPIAEEYIERLKKYSEQRLNVSNNLIVHDLIRMEKNNLKEEMSYEK